MGRAAGQAASWASSLGGPRCERRPDHNADQAGFLQEAPPWPEIACVVCNRNELRLGLGCEQRPRHAVLAGLARLDARAFRNDQDPDAGRKACAALFEDLIHGAVTGGIHERKPFHDLSNSP
jgi:hypothetical protein